MQSGQNLDLLQNLVSVVVGYLTVDTAIVLTGNPSRYTSQLTLNNYFAILTQFGFQEPGTNEEIKAFAASKNFTGLLMDKINVNGSKTSPVFAYLKVASGDTSLIGWNFAKFLVRCSLCC